MGVAWFFHRSEHHPEWVDGASVTRSEVLGSMIEIPGGSYIIGDERANPRPDAPLVEVTIDSFYLDRYAVTNQQFAEFVEETGYVTTAEKEGGGWIYKSGNRDWAFQKGANWRTPLGPNSSIEGAEDRPVVLVSWHDANAYADWAGKRLPTEAEWEIAARSASNAGDVVLQNPTQTSEANVWQGHWPDYNTMENGYYYVAPVGSFPPNALGFYEMIGNTWEWTQDWYTDNPNERGLEEPNPCGAKSGNRRVARGGSWFCSENYCSGYWPYFRGKSPPGHAFNNVGFRCAKSSNT